MSLFQPLCKFCASVRRVRDIVPTLRAAMAAAQSGTPGPVFVELPVDVLYPYFIVQKELAPARPVKGLMGRVVSWYLENHLANLFAGAWEPQPEGPLPVDIPWASPQQVIASPPWPRTPTWQDGLSLSQCWGCTLGGCW